MVEINTNKNQQTFECIFRNDSDNCCSESRFPMSINGNTSISEFYILVAEKINFASGTFQISYLTKEKAIILNEDWKDILSNFLDSSETNQKFLIKDKQTVAPVKIAKEDYDLDGVERVSMCSLYAYEFDTICISHFKQQEN